MENQFDFNDLFVLDLANNHQGSVQHGLNIITQASEVVKASGVRAAIKFQFRQLDTFIHPSCRDKSTNKHIPRFLSTRLSQKDFGRLLKEVKNLGFVSMCTPFDEESVDVIEEMDFDVIKIGSCSARDWPLLERVAETNKPVIFSTGGLHDHHVNDLVSFFEHRSVNFAIMHCVSIYPTPDEHCHLNQIQSFRNRYPSHVIGWSTHENPDDTAHVQIAYAKGARMFERHIGVKTDKIKLNTYSSTPEQIGHWIESYRRARVLCGSSERLPATEVEKDSIRSLQRGIFAKTLIKRGTVIRRDQVYFAMPHQDGQLESGRWCDGIVAQVDFENDAAVLSKSVGLPKSDEVLVIKRVVHEVKAMLNQAGIVLNSEFKVEYSHHYGIKKLQRNWCRYN